MIKELLMILLLFFVVNVMAAVIGTEGAVLVLLTLLWFYTIKGEVRNDRDE